jgi:hypothetical protein
MPRTFEHRRDERILIAEEAYLFGFPIVLMEQTRRIATNVPADQRPGSGPMNWFTHLRAFPPGDFKEVVRPNFDTLYSLLWFDLRNEPLVISVPDTAGRYYMLPFLDMWSDVFAVLGRRATGTGAGHYVLVGPGWSGPLPDGVERLVAPTSVGWALGRTQTNGVADYAAVHRIQDGLVATPLSRWPDAPTPPPATPDSTVDMTTATLDQVLALSGVEMLRRTAELMIENPPHPGDQPVLARMRRLGLVTGQRLDVDGLDTEVREAIEAGASSARARMSKIRQLHPVVNGWSQPTFAMGTYGTDYWRRATVAKVGLGANRVEDAVYPILIHDATGVPPVGETRYVLHFDADALPPADAFWSVTMYDGDGFTVPNDLDRYALGDRDPLVYNADGSLDLYLQHDDPGEARRANWLPSPTGPLGVTMRIYDPRPEVLDGLWSPPPLLPAWDV